MQVLKTTATVEHTAARSRTAGQASHAPAARPQARGKFLYRGDEKLYVKGVTYGTFATDADGSELLDRDVVRDDFAAMAEHGINSVRTYTVPPRWLLDIAEEQGLLVLVGLPWEQHVTFLEDRRRTNSIVQRVRAGVEACAGHPAVLGYAVGNEIPAPIVRWHGRTRVEGFLERLYATAKDADPDGLVTYVNYPSTEYLELPFFDFCAVNVYLEDIDRLKSYLARLQNIAGDRPLVLAELGLDSRRNGQAKQAEVLYDQLGAVYESGCAGTFVFAWTDEWHRGGQEIDDWDFGLTDRSRSPKYALAGVSDAFAEVPLRERDDWPSISVVVCSHNGARTIEETCAGLRGLDYPNFEVVVVDDGSTDDTAAIARSHGFQVISTENQGLSAARNLGWQAATGEIVAYLDDDACPDSDWLRYLAHTFLTSDHAAAGGPNVPPADAGLVESCVAAAPGGPIHVLISDSEAEHLPGCNLAIRRSVLEELGGFDPQFRAAGDDVDMCWRIMETGRTIGYSPAALVWHRRRDTVRGYLRQQRGYGKAEAMLERKWPEHYNISGHRTWNGTIYGRGNPLSLSRSLWRVYYGSWGSGLFQRLYEPAPGVVGSLPLMPEWWLLLGLLAGFGLLGLSWAPLLLALPVLALALGITVTEAGLSVRHAWRGRRPGAWTRLLTTWLYLAQPVVRLRGRLGQGLTPWRRRARSGFIVPRRRTVELWSEHWRPAEERLRDVLAAIDLDGIVPIVGGDFDRWDIEVRGGMLGSARLRQTVEEHGGGCQLVRHRVWPRPSWVGVGLPLLLAAFALAALEDTSWFAAAVLALATVAVAVKAAVECGCSSGALVRAAPAAEPRDDDVVDTLLEQVHLVRESNLAPLPAESGEHARSA